MRIAVSGAHRTGKTTLIEELGRLLPEYEPVDEPYHLLEEEGYEFAESPSLEDFELQLERSLDCLADGKENPLFDRCPADLLAYLRTHEDSDGFDFERWLPRARAAMQGLDLVVYVPAEDPGSGIVVEADEEDLRRRVDEELRDILLGDRWDFGVETIEVTGSSRERARQVLRHLTGRIGDP